jgi:hypothetical protein
MGKAYVDLAWSQPTRNWILRNSCDDYNDNNNNAIIIIIIIIIIVIIIIKVLAKSELPIAGKHWV